MKEYYLQKDNYVNATGTIIHIAYSKDHTELYLGLSELTPTFDDIDFKIVGDNLSILSWQSEKISAKESCLCGIIGIRITPFLGVGL